MRSALRRLHRWIGLTLLALWLVQAGTGVLMVYHWELGDARITGPAVPTDWAGLERRYAQLQADPPGERVRYVYPTAGASDRYDFFLEDAAGVPRTVRTNGAGDVLAAWSAQQASWLDGAVLLHQSLFAGHAGRLLLGASGLFLLTSLLFGLRLAWPTRREGLRPLRPPTRGPLPARLHGWHRALGLWLALPALVIVSAGILLAFDDAVEGMLDAQAPQPASPQAVASLRVEAPIGPARAVATALARFPGATFAGMTLPVDGKPWYRIRVRQPGEWRRVYGTTTLYIAEGDGTIVLTADALRAPLVRRFLDACWPFHTGEAAGPLGRALVLCTALALLASMLLGTLLWWRRRRPASAAARGVVRGADTL